MHAARVLEHWGEFYLLIGTAAAALVALLFVAASIGVGAFTPNPKTRTYMSPVAFHFASVLAASAVALAPSNTALSLATLIGLGGIGYAAFVFKRLLTDDVADLADRFCYGVLPLASYAIALISAWLFFSVSAHAPDILACSLVILLIVNIRNAWDLLLAMARMHYNASRSDQ